MFEIENNILYKYIGNDKVVKIPDHVEIISTNAFDNNLDVETIIGNNVKKVCYNAIIATNLKVLELPKVEEIQQLNDLKKIELLKVNINTKFSSIRYLNPNLKLELLNGSDSIVYTSNPNLLNKLDNIKSDYGYKNDFFVLIFNKKLKRFAINDKMENYILFLNNICSIERFLNSIPKEFNNLIFDKGYNFCILNDKLILNDQYIGGIVYKDLDLVLASAEDVNDSILREIARIIDDEYNFSSSDHFRLCFKLESSKIYSKTKTLKTFDLEYIYHIIQNPHEYFCECFSRFYKKENILEDECPFTWDFLSHIDLEARNEKHKEKCMTIN